MRSMRAVFFAGAAAALLAGEAIAAEGSGNATEANPSASLSAVKPPRDFPDVPLANDPKVSEQAESVAAHPDDPRRLLAAISRADPSSDCIVRASGDGGRTWRPAVRLPAPVGTCSGAVVAYAPDGRQSFAAYASLKPGGCNGFCPSGDILFSVSEDDGASWSAPVIAMKTAADGTWFEKPRLVTPLRPVDNKYVYIAAKGNYTFHHSRVAFAQSSNGGRTWSAPQVLASYDYMFGGAGDYALAGGLGGEVLLVWNAHYYANGLDEIRAARSRDFGRTFAAPLVASQAHGATTYDPDVKIDGRGVAHIAYRTMQGEGERIRYITSPGAPYGTWSSPVTLDDDGSGHTHRAPAMAVEDCGGASVLHVTWLDNRSAADRWDVFYTRKIAGPGYAWSRNIRVSDRSSPAYPQYGDGWNGLAAGAGGAFAIWTQRRQGTDPNIYAFDVYGSRIESGVSCLRQSR